MARAAALPLLDWPQLAEIGRLEAERAELVERIARLKPHCHRRVVLEYRLRLVTARQLKLTADLVP